MGLIGGIARTAVVAGTFTAVSNRVSRRQTRRWAQKDQSAYPPQQYAPQQYTPQYRSSTRPSNTHRPHRLRRRPRREATSTCSPSSRSFTSREC